MQKKPKYLPKEFDPLMMEQDDVTPEELIAHFTKYALAHGFDPSQLYDSHLRFQAESAGHIAELAEMLGIGPDIVEECRQARRERQRRLEIIREARSESV